MCPSPPLTPPMKTAVHSPHITFPSWVCGRGTTQGLLMESGASYFAFAQAGFTPLFLLGPGFFAPQFPHKPSPCIFCGFFLAWVQRWLRTWNRPRWSWVGFPFDSFPFWGMKLICFGLFSTHRSLGVGTLPYDAFVPPCSSMRWRWITLMSAPFNCVAISSLFNTVFRFFDTRTDSHCFFLPVEVVITAVWLGALFRH